MLTNTLSKFSFKYKANVKSTYFFQLMNIQQQFSRKTLPTLQYMCASAEVGIHAFSDNRSDMISSSRTLQNRGVPIMA